MSTNSNSTAGLTNVFRHMSEFICDILENSNRKFVFMTNPQEWRKNEEMTIRMKKRMKTRMKEVIINYSHSSNIELVIQGSLFISKFKPSLNENISPDPHHDISSCHFVGFRLLNKLFSHINSYLYTCKNFVIFHSEDVAR